MNQLGKTLIIIGLLTAAAGFALLLASRFGLPLGRLPGDLTWHKKGVTVFAPFGTMLVVSVVLSLLLNLFSRWK